MSPHVERIDHILWRWLLQATSRPRQYIWRWWQYGLKEPPVDHDQANAVLLAACGYKLEPSKAMKMASCRPGIRWFRFGVYVSATPAHHKNRHWQMYWCRWIDDPFELYLVRCALRPRPAPANTSEPQPSPLRPYTGTDSLLDRIDMDELLRD